MMFLTLNFTLAEMIHSDTARKLKMPNVPTSEQVNNLKVLCQKCLQPIRDHYKKEVKVNSGFRCHELNKKIGGSPTSQHTKGMAADITIKGVKIKDIIQWCRDNLHFDQLINEKDQWVHISYNQAKNRNQVLYWDGKTYKGT